MLKNFFELNSSASVLRFASEDALVAHFHHSSSLQNAELTPPFSVARQKMSGKVFENVRLSSAHFSQVTFRDCTFRDCLLIGTRFEDCEFHDCCFEGCNTHKIQLRNVYIDPRSFRLSKQSRQKHSNIGAYLYQQLYMNAAEMHQTAFAASADIERRRWFRYQKRWALKEKGVSRLAVAAKLLPDQLFDWVAKYGYGPSRFLIVSLLSFAALGLAAKFMWPFLGMARAEDSIYVASYADALYFCMLLTTTLGFSDIVPSTGAGRAFAIACAVYGIGWAGLFTSILVRRIIR